ncbi:glycosyltransferase [Bacillus velezensis]|uniref:glycosyltransferase n=1 Tax=Bacillus velezensis TaxID=492670 RepID=UPI0039AFC16A
MSSIDVIIPVFNDYYPLRVSLLAYLDQTFDKNEFKIIVVDDGSTKDIKSVCKEFENQLNLIYIRKKREGRSAARNVGVSHSMAKRIVFSDADRFPARDFIEKHNTFQKEFYIGDIREIYSSKISNNEKKILNYRDKEIFRRVNYATLIYNLFDDNGLTDSNLSWLATFSGNMSLDRDEFEKIGGFDENFKDWGFEHFEFGYRYFNYYGKPLIYKKDCINWHIAHKRDLSNLKEKWLLSYKIFLEKYNSYEIRCLIDFMFGNISLQSYEKLINDNYYDLKWIKNTEKALFHKL